MYDYPLLNPKYKENLPIQYISNDKDKRRLTQGDDFVSVMTYASIPEFDVVSGELGYDSNYIYIWKKE